MKLFKYSQVNDTRKIINQLPRKIEDISIIFENNFSGYKSKEFSVSGPKVLKCLEYLKKQSI